MSVFAFVKK